VARGGGKSPEPAPELAQKLVAEMHETLSRIDIQAKQALLSKIMAEAEWGKQIWILSVLFPTLCP
jgi:hypothetical protein